MKRIEKNFACGSRILNFQFSILNFFFYPAVGEIHKSN